MPKFSSILACAFFLLAIPSFAVDLVGVSIDSIWASIHSGGVTCPYGWSVGGSVVQGGTGTFDLGSHGLIELSVLDHRISVAAVSPLPCSEYVVHIMTFSFVAPSNSVSVPVIVSAAAPSPAAESVGTSTPGAVGAVGGRYPTDSGSRSNIFPITVFVIGGDSVSVTGQFSAYFNGSSNLIPSTFTPIFELHTAAVSTPATPECGDGIDNDGDGAIDLADGDCANPDDTSELHEFNTAGWGCGLGPELALVLPSLWWLRRRRSPAARL